MVTDEAQIPCDMGLVFGLISCQLIESHLTNKTIILPCRLYENGLEAPVWYEDYVLFRAKNLKFRDHLAKFIDSYNYAEVATLPSRYLFKTLAMLTRENIVLNNIMLDVPNPFGIS